MQRTNGDVIVGGVDEAGRGSIIGPLVVAGISFKKSAVSEVRKIGVKDSKALTSKSRISLYAQLKGMAKSICVYKIHCNVIDDNVYLKGLNKLEAKMMARVINNLQADEIYVDSCDVNPERYAHRIRSYLPAINPKLRCMHHADRINSVVSAASIVAKITRDQEIEKIRKTHSNIGSGYPCDSKTMGFIREWILKHKYAPSFARKSWRPLRQMLEQIDQYQLDQI